MEKDSLNEDHLRKILYKSSYNLNESAKIREISEADFSEDDEMPEDVIPLSNDGSELPKAEDKPTPDIENNDENPQKPIQQEVQPQQEIPQIQSNDEPIDDEKNVDELQNDLIKLNLSSMNKMYDKLTELSNNVIELNNRYEKLNQDVDEVREPSNEEKLINKKYDSHPYYKNLSDMWEGNWFQGREDEYSNDEKDGIKKLDNGTYVANYEDLPKVNNINNTF